MFNNRNLSPILSTKDEEEDVTPMGVESLSIARTDIRKSHTTLAKADEGFEKGHDLAIRA